MTWVLREARLLSGNARLLNGNARLTNHGNAELQKASQSTK